MVATLAFGVIAAWFLCGCRDVAPGPEDNEARGDLFAQVDPPKPEQALVYVYRPKAPVDFLPESMGVVVHDARFSGVVGYLKIGGYLAYYAMPGVVRMSTGQSASQPLLLLLAGGKTYYVREYGLALKLVGPNSGREEIASCRSPTVTIDCTRQSCATGGK